MEEILKQLKNNKPLKNELIRVKEECEKKGMSISECAACLCKTANDRGLKINHPVMEQILGLGTEEIKLRCNNGWC